jgi:thiol-disulfide isomerase/thioredoxin
MIINRGYRRLSALFLSLALSLPISGLCEDKAPEFELPGQQGPIKLSDYRGQLVYLDFWASWCTPCLKSFPWMAKLQQTYQSQGLVVIAINLDTEQKLADDFLQEHPVNFLIGFDPKGTTPLAYSVRGMPSSFIIDRNGNIVSSHIGFNSDKEKLYEQAIKQALRSTSLTDDNSSTQTLGVSR